MTARSGLAWLRRPIKSECCGGSTTQGRSLEHYTRRYRPHQYRQREYWQVPRLDSGQPGNKYGWACEPNAPILARDWLAYQRQPQPFVRSTKPRARECINGGPVDAPARLPSPFQDSQSLPACQASPPHSDPSNPTASYS